jgi:hypothetical protein
MLTAFINPSFKIETELSIEIGIVFWLTVGIELLFDMGIVLSIESFDTTTELLFCIEIIELLLTVFSQFSSNICGK